MIAGGHGHGTVPVGLGGDVDPQNPGVEHVIRCLMESLNNRATAAGE